MSKNTYSEKEKIIKEAIKTHGYAVVLFIEYHYDGYSPNHYYRRRKVYADGKCFVSYLGHTSKRWSSYAFSCFLCELNMFSVNDTLSLMKKHDEQNDIEMVAIMRNGRRVKL